ncbi:unnamed protein product, partial [Gulo gulo]
LPCVASPHPRSPLTVSRVLLQPTPSLLSSVPPAPQEAGPRLRPLGLGSDLLTCGKAPTGVPPRNPPRPGPDRDSAKQNKGRRGCPAQRPEAPGQN